MSSRRCAIGALSLLVIASPLTAGLTYTVLDLGTLGGSSGDGYAVNKNGIVTGASYVSDDEQRSAFFTGANGALPLRNLGTLGGTQSATQAINANGFMAGASSFSGDTVYHAWFSNGNGLLDLGTLGGTNSYGYAINGSGQVAGYSLITRNSASRAFLSDANGGALHQMGVLAGGVNSYGFAVNASGQVAGYSGTSSGYNHAFFTEVNGGALHDLGTLDGTSSFATALNDSGQVVGRSNLNTFAVHAFRSGPNGGPLLDLGTLGGTSSYGQGINAYGAVVGYSYLSDNGTQHAFIYTTQNGMADLNNLIPAGAGWILTNARGINDVGQITGSGTVGGYTHVFLLMPVYPDLHIISVSKLPNGDTFIVGAGSPLKAYNVEASNNVHGPFATIAAITSASDGTLQFEDTESLHFSGRFYRLLDPSAP